MCPPAARTTSSCSTPSANPTGIDNPKDHLELGESLGLIDMERGAKVSGSRFYFLTGRGALLQLGLLQLAVRLATENGFTLMIPPVLVRPEIMAGTGFLGAHADEIYRLEADDLYLVGTSEVPLAGYHSDEILDLSAGPLRYAGWSSCFRREAGSYGKDTRGIIRVHQFDKVEGFVYCKPEDAEAEHQRLLGWQREMLALIDVPYRVIDVAAGDLGSSAARKFDCEAWVPTQQTYRELTSTSNCTTFQARRLATRYRDENGKPQTAATLNGTLATTRWLVAILENHQQPDGSVRVPAGAGALRRHGGTGTVIDLDLDELRTWFGFGVAGNFAGHLEQAGEAVDFVNVESEGRRARRGSSPGTRPGHDSFLGEFPLSHDALMLPEPGADGPLNLQIEPEVGAGLPGGLGAATPSSALRPFALGAFNDCSIRRPGRAQDQPQEELGSGIERCCAAVLRHQRPDSGRADRHPAAGVPPADCRRRAA